MDGIILAAGLGQRMKLGYPKQFYKIGGKPFFIYSLEVFSQVKDIDRIILVCHPDHIELYKKHVDGYKIPNVLFVDGGNTRQESVYNGLKLVKTHRVIIHEAARPLISKEFVEYILSFDEEQAVIPTLPVKFTVSVGDDYMLSELDRSKLRNVQLPQVFDTSLLKNAHKKAIEDKYTSTEDGTLVFHYGGKVRFIQGRESNIKITTPLDIEMVNNILKFNY